MLIFNRKSKRFGRYPACDFLNSALRLLLKHPQENRAAIEEICRAISKANGYFYDYVHQKLADEKIWDWKEKRSHE